MQKRRLLAPAPPMLLLALAACHAPARSSADLPPPCGVPALLGTALAAELAQGRPAETSFIGSCVATAARQGSIAAAMLLADSYRHAMARPGFASPALGLDLFGRHIGWLHMAADRGDPAAQLLLAQETDSPASMAMPDATLSWYQAAAENGNGPAQSAIATAYRRGRIADERLYDFRNWLAAHKPRPGRS